MIICFELTAFICLAVIDVASGRSHVGPTILKTKAYQDVAAIWTIGNSHTGAASAAAIVITEAKDEDTLLFDLAMF